MGLKKIYILVSIIVLFISLRLSAQEGHVTHDENPAHEEHHFQHHRLALFTGYSLIQGAVDVDGQKKPKIIPVIGLDYEYFFTHKYGIGLLTDLELSTYSIEDNHQDYIERNFAFVSALVFLYEPIIGWALFAGPGYEFEKDHGFALVKIGSELSKNFQDGWSIGLGASVDIKEVNSSFSFGLLQAKGWVNKL